MTNIPNAAKFKGDREHKKFVNQLFSIDEVTENLIETINEVHAVGGNKVYSNCLYYHNRNDRKWCKEVAKAVKIRFEDKGYKVKIRKSLGEYMGFLDFKNSYYYLEVSW